MLDQASTLRNMMGRRAGPARPSGTGHRAPRVLTVSSGKGGVGKSCLVANLGAKLARAGQRVLLVDGDTGLANLDILMGLPTDGGRATLEQVLEGSARIQDAILGVEPNLWLVPSRSGLMDYRDGTPATRARLAKVLEECPWEMDLVLLDAGSGVGEDVLSLHHPSFETVVVVTPEPTSFADGYGLIKMVRRERAVTRVRIVVNQVTDGREGQRVFQKLKDVAGKFSDVQLDYLGHWERDEKVSGSVMKRKILLDWDEAARSLPSLDLIAKRVISETAGLRREGAGFWSILLAGAEFKAEGKI
jgi:flagellar biosynthesis protein FlhG